MVIISPLAVVVLFILMIAFAAAIAWITHPKNDTSRTHIFITSLAGLGIFLTFIFYFNMTNIQQDQQILTQLEQTHAINDSILASYMKEVKQAVAKNPSFVVSLMPLTTFPGEIPPNEQTVEAIVQRSNLSYKIFFIWQDFLITNDFLSLEDPGYLDSFLQLANSKQLLEAWEIKKYDFDQRTIDFGDLLFEYAADLSPTPQAYQQAALKLFDDPRYRKLVTKPRKYFW